MIFDIDGGKAASWQNEVKQELAEVELLLDQVGTSLEDFPGEGDSMTEVIQRTGHALVDQWGELCTKFKTTIDAIGDVIKMIGTEVSDRVEAFENFMH